MTSTLNHDSVQRPRISRQNLATLLSSNPHCGALGLAIGTGEDDVALVMPARNAHRLRAGEAAWHPGAIGSAMDTILSMSALTVIDPESRPATVDLRWELLKDVPFGDLRLVATRAQPTEEAVFAQGEIIHAESGALVGRAHACVAYAPPIAGEKREQVPSGERETLEAPDFRTWLGLSSTDSGVATVPYRQALGGAVGYPFWHGGALTAAMTAAALDRAEQALPGARLMTATASFNLFAVDQPVVLDTSDWRATRTRASIYVACTQEGRGTTTRLAAHFTKAR